MARVMGVDFGGRRVGIAISDPLGMFAQPLSTYDRQGKSLEEAADHLAALCREQEADTVVMGLPLHLSGQEGEGSRKVRDFAVLLKDRGLAVVLQDERLTTVMAQRALREGNVRGRQRVEVVDRVAAVIILQTYLDKGR